MTTVAGLFRNWDNAAQAIDLLSTSGFSADNISMVATQDVAKKHRDDTGAGGRATGTTVAGGVTPAAVAGTTAFSGNGMGAFYFTGPLLQGGGADRQAAAGHEKTPDDDKNRQYDLLASLMDAGVPRERAEAYAEAIRHGDVLVAVQTDDNAAQARSLLNQANAAQVSGI